MALATIFILALSRARGKGLEVKGGLGKGFCIHRMTLATMSVGFRVRDRD